MDTGARSLEFADLKVTKAAAFAAACPSCGDSRVRKVGAIPDVASFAGRSLEQPLPGGFLYRCRSCGLGYRHPRQSRDRLNELYQGGDNEAWSTPEGEVRNDWIVATKWIREHGRTGSVLDVGCLQGDFLVSIGSEHTLYGLEMHRGAAEAAAKRGVAIVGNDFYELESLEAKYDWVVAFDVIEHSDDPREFLRQLASKCTPGGHVIISTGNIEAPSWRLMGSRYWYCTIAEHLAFISPAWCESVAAHCGLRLVRHSEFSHNPSSIANRASQLLKNVFYRVAPSAAAWARSAGFGKENVATLPALRFLPPKWDCARDHFIALFRAES